MKKFLALVFFLMPCSISWAKVYVTEPLLVQQPSYAGMEFYVFKPYNMPSGWYVTFDGYPVKKNPDGVWVYGTSEGPNLVGTNYVVGSVIPSMAGITPYINQAQISELRSLPGQELLARQPNLSQSKAAQGQNYSTWIPDWTFNQKFMAVGKWKSTVDRIGILNNPALPVAWKGSNPKVIYIWTGEQWYQITRRDEKSAASAIKRELYKITKFHKKTRFKWYEQDTPVLAQHARTWGYYWLGEIQPR